jgi:hypothetical protein
MWLNWNFSLPQAYEPKIRDSIQNYNKISNFILLSGLVAKNFTHKMNKWND